MVKLFIIILNYNGQENTLICLNSLKNVGIPADVKLETVVVDNNSRDSSSDKIKKKFSNLTLIENKENLGFTGGNNVGFKHALEEGADYILILNNDTIVDKNLISELYKTIVSDKNIGGVVPKIYFEKGYEFHKEKYEKEDLGKIIWYAGGIMDWKNLIGKNRGVDEIDKGQYDRKEEMSLATGCCFLIRADVLKEIGLFDERFYLYYEDADLSEKIKKKGLKIVYEPKGIVWHKNAESSGGSGSELQDYYITRNRLLFGMRYAPLRTKLALVRESFKLLRSGRLWQKKGVADFYSRKFGRGSFNI